MEKCRKKTFQGGIQNETEKNDNIVIKYVYVEAAWDSTGAKIYNIVHE